MTKASAEQSVGAFRGFGANWCRFPRSKSCARWVNRVRDGGNRVRDTHRHKIKNARNGFSSSEDLLRAIFRFESYQDRTWLSDCSEWFINRPTGRLSKQKSVKIFVEYTHLGYSFQSTCVFRASTLCSTLHYDCKGVSFTFANRLFLFYTGISEKCVFPGWGTVLITLRRLYSKIILRVFCTMFEAGICTHHKAATRVTSRTAARKKLCQKGRFLHFFVIQ